MYRFRMTVKQHSELKTHLHNGDGLEAVAFGLCGTLKHSGETYLLLNEVILVPYDKCKRAKDYVNWKYSDIEHIIDDAKNRNLSVIKFHSHPFGNSDFSDLDNDSDTRFFESVYNILDNDLIHGSLIMYNDGSLNGRVILSSLDFIEFKSISIIGSTFFKECMSANLDDGKHSEAMERNRQAFGTKTVSMLKNMKIAIIGCSGTGSPTIEQLVRLGVGELVLIDPDVGDLVNLNRILGLTYKNADGKKPKVETMQEHIEAIGLETKVIAINSYLQDNQIIINEVASCDFIFGCTDTAEGRHAMNLIGHHFLVPFIDIGVKLSADGKGGIESISGNIHYVYPGSKSLLERKVISPAKMEEEELFRISPDEYKERQVYFDNASVSSPAVISVNMMHSSMAVLELLDRIHPYRYNDSTNYEATRINITDWSIEGEKIGVSKSKFFLEETMGIGQNASIPLYE